MEKKIAFKNDWCFITFGPINLKKNNAFFETARRK